MSRRQASHPNVFARVWWKAFASGRRKASSAVRPAVRPRLEYLEDRLVPAVIDVTTLADGAGPGTLRSAIAQANANDATGDTTNTINLTVAGTYNVGQSGLGALQIFTNATTGQSGLSLTIQNTSGGTVAISGNNQTRVFDINPNDINGGATPNGLILGAVTINGLTIENGLAQPGDGGAASGGGIRDLGPVDLTLNNDIIANNSATADGGGVSMENTVSTKWKLNLNNTTVINNHAGDAGGGIDEDGTGFVNINNSTISDNTCLNQGAGVWLDAINGGTAALTVSNSLVNGNTAGMLGGGLGNAGNSAVSIVNSTIENNFATGFGGGFADENNLGTLAVQNSLFLNNSAGTNGGGIQEGGGLTITNSEIKGNAAGMNGAMPIGSSLGVANPVMGNGGGLFVDGGSLTLTNSSVVGNTASLNGGGIELETTVASAIRNTTIVGNTALNNAAGVGTVFNDGGGIDDASTGGLSLVDDTITGNFGGLGGGLFSSEKTGLTIQDTIIAQNLASIGGRDLLFIGNIPGVDQGGNLIGIVDPGVFTSGTTQQGTEVNPLNPQLAGLANYGGPAAGATGTQMTIETEAELLGSPAVGKGVANGITNDERGFPRVNTSDVGAFQFQNATLQVNIGISPNIGIGTTQTAKVTVTNTSGNALPADNSILTVTASGGLNIGGTQTFTLGPIGAGQSQTFSVNVSGTALGTQTLTASVTSPDAKPSTVSISTTVHVVQQVTPVTPTTPVGNLTLFALGLGPTGIDLFEVDSVGKIFAVPFGSGGAPIFVSTMLKLQTAVLQDGKLLALLVGSTGQTFVAEIINPFLPSVMSAVLAALHL